MALASLSLLFGIAATENLVYAAVVPADLVAWWELGDTSDSAPGGSRPLTLKGNAALSGSALVLNGPPSGGATSDRAVSSAYNPSNSFSVIIDFQLDQLPPGSDQYALLGNIGTDRDSGASNFDTSAGYQIFVVGGSIIVWQKSTANFTQTAQAGVGLGAGTARHTVVVNWELTGLSFKPTIFRDGSSTTATASSGNPMDFTSATSDLILGTNIDWLKGHHRTTDGRLFEVALFSDVLSAAQVDLVAAQGIAALVPEPSTFALAALGLLGLLGCGRRRRR